MNIKTFYFNPFRECTYIVQDGDNTIIIDPGMLTEKEQARFKEYLDEHHLMPTHILITHTHEDHICGLNWLQSTMLQTPDTKHQTSPINQLPEGWQLIPTPGHKEDAVCFYVPKEGVLFSGDTLFQESIGRTDLPGGDMSVLIRSLEKLKQLPPETVVYPGHGYTTTIAHEIEYNPYF
ncbi:MAG: MBL fold metallo-hydrolase [Paludibacteraceae bacterium]|nr:MBL fold metallo-hydrolase [Paludibacteraceae bacterium]